MKKWILVLLILIASGCTNNYDAEDLESAIAENDLTTMLKMSYDRKMGDQAGQALSDYYSYVSGTAVQVGTINLYARHRDEMIDILRSHLTQDSQAKMNKTLKHIRKLMQYEKKILTATRFNFPRDSALLALSPDLIACSQRLSSSKVAEQALVLHQILNERDKE